ncbi:MAG: DUF1934 domain-containing protein [Lachnospiraceae bacterium]|jgi:uncharacterized beta-barrel protein YwiB (DUF1934 family)|nr:DUF1934 domain-containing protein [Lachnospiraceae bacterium]
MTKEVLLSLQGLQFDAVSADGDKIETITPAEYYKRNDSHYVIFEEAMEGFQEKTKNVIKFKENSLDLTKKGLVNVHMIFEENKKNMTNYATPYGNILIGIDARSVRLKEKEERIEVDVDYALEVNYEHFADCKIKMDIRAKNGEGFSLQ